MLKLLSMMKSSDSKSEYFENAIEKITKMKSSKTKNFKVPHTCNLARFEVECT